MQTSNNTGYCPVFMTSVPVRHLLAASTIVGACLAPITLTQTAEASTHRDVTSRYINMAKLQAIVPPRPRYAMKRNAAFLIGDSITTQAWVGGRMPQRARNHRYAFLGVESIGGITTQRMLERLTRQKWINKLPRRIVVALGSNDAWSGTPPEQFRASLTQLLDQLQRPNQPRHIILVNISATGNPIVHEQSLQLNTIINEYATRPRTRILNWARIVERNPRWIDHTDPYRMHLSKQGMIARANLYYHALKTI